MLELLRASLPAEATAAKTVLEDAARILDESIAQPRPRYFAFVGSSGLEIGVIGDALASCFDPNLAVYAGAASDIEEQAVRWVGELIGYPAAAGAFTSGGTISNLTGLAAARERALPGVRRDGLGGRRGGGVLLGRGPLLDRTRGRAAGHGHQRRAGGADRRSPADAARPARRGDRRRPGGRDHAGGGRRHRGDDADRRDRSAGRDRRRVRGAGRVVPHRRGVRPGGRGGAGDAGPLRRPGARGLGHAGCPQVAVSAQGLRGGDGARRGGAGVDLRSQRGLSAAPSSSAATPST